MYCSSYYHWIFKLSLHHMPTHVLCNDLYQRMELSILLEHNAIESPMLIHDVKGVLALTHYGQEGKPSFAVLLDGPYISTCCSSSECIICHIEQDLHFIFSAGSFFFPFKNF